MLATTTAVALMALRTADDPRRGRRTALGVTAALAVCLHPLVALPTVAGILGVLWLRPGRARRGEVTVVALPAAEPLPRVVVGLLGGYFNSRYGTAAVPGIAALAATGASAAAAQLAAQDRYGDAVVFVGAVARPLVERYLPPGELASGRLDDALLAPGNQHADTLGGEDVPAGARRAALADRDRPWVVGTMAVATDDLSRRSSITRAAEAGRTMVSRTDHGHVRVELWSTGPS